MVGYQKAEIGIRDIKSGGGTIGKFYKKGNDPWKYFVSAQMELDCSYYSSADLRNAFMGDPCYDSNSKTSTVK